MKKLTLSVLSLLCTLFVLTAATNTPPIPVKGSIDIQYNTRQGSPTKGVKDVYDIKVNVGNTALFHGTISDTPLIMGGILGNTVNQPRSLNYDVACDLVNPKNPSQVKNVGRMFGTVPIDQNGVYRYDSGNLLISILPMGQAGGLDSKFTGAAYGKPLVRPANWLDSLKRDAVNITRQINGKQMTVVLRKYDKMEFRQCVVAAGPIQSYGQVTVNGEMLYDYEKYTWFFNNFTIQYPVTDTNGVTNIKIDRIAGYIRWVESPKRKSDGLGEYQFDIRVNEPVPNEASAFVATANTDESAFFETDSTIPAINGTMKYKDTLRGDTTLASSVTVDLLGNNVTKQQVMAITKLVLFSAVVPMNAD